MFKFTSKFFINNYNLLKNITRIDQYIPSPILNRPIQSSIASNLNENILQNFNEKKTFENVKNTLLRQQEGRLFAVVQICGKQFKITDGDIVLVQGYWPPTNGDKIRLDKVLLAGSNDFTLVGRPILQPGICEVQATIVEKTLSHIKTHFRKKRRKQYQRINFHRTPHTMIRINSVNINPQFDSDQKNSYLKLF